MNEITLVIVERRVPNGQGHKIDRIVVRVWNRVELDVDATVCDAPRATRRKLIRKRSRRDYARRGTRVIERDVRDARRTI